MAIILTMVALGTLLGFVGAGGAGFIIAILTLVFKVPIYQALGTSLAAMIFTSLSGAYSHFREGNVVLKVGLITGGFGALGAFMGSKIAFIFPSYILPWLTAGMLFLSSFLLLTRLFMVKNRKENPNGNFSFLLGRAAVLGGIFGIVSGTVGIGCAPFIQIGLYTLLGLSIRQSVGTTMLVIVPIAIGGGVGYISEGYLDLILLFQVLVGTIFGAYVGAKFTNFAPQSFLKVTMVGTPVLAGFLLLI
ncbi:membrane protein [Peribacillus asahii]|uniref:Probable membrane transporter protein n=1 Tax=Peribacillus asahii TaxID=228899 RepID=A0A3T0KLL1_9BACI|nr:sulfite exporter TauE/SafE family protein [Peribacillus asahii]AZV41144.1 membrane protein [Peribacillus asahii]